MNKSFWAAPVLATVAGLMVMAAPAYAVTSDQLTITFPTGVIQTVLAPEDFPTVPEGAGHYFGFITTQIDTSYLGKPIAILDEAGVSDLVGLCISCLASI